MNHLDLRKACVHGFYDAHPGMGGIWRCNGGQAPTKAELIDLVDNMDGVCVYVRGQMGYDRERDEAEYRAAKGWLPLTDNDWMQS